jgi:hypothetical protein
MQDAGRGDRAYAHGTSAEALIAVDLEPRDVVLPVHA